MAKLLLATAWLLPAFSTAYLQVSYPLNLQLPPVALAGEPYQYQLAPTTFETDSDKLQYSLTGNPTWLSLDSKSRTLSGTPSASDTGEISFKVTAAGSAGAVVHMDSKLLVAGDNGPGVEGNVTQVLANAGQISGSNTMNIGPSKPIDITFPLDTFASNGSSLSYYALLADHTPLPAWINFEASSLHFVGTTPSITSTQTLDILLIASHTPGYAASSLPFNLVISNHQLCFQPYAQTLNLSKGEDINIDLKSTLLMDGAPIQEMQIQSVNATLPSWLKLDNKTSVITGIAPVGMMSQDLSVNVTDQFGDAAQLEVHIYFKSELFASEIGQLNATIGENFDYPIPPSLLSNNNERLSVDLASLSRYLHFDPTKSTISGTITQDFPAQKVQCTLTALSSDGSQKDTQIFQIIASSATGSGVADAPSGTTNTSSSQDERSGGKTAGVIIGSIIGAICGILLLVGLALCLRRRKQHENYNNPKRLISPRKSNISRPMFIPLGWPDVDVDQEQDLEKGKSEHDFLMERAPENPPKLDLDLVDDRDSHSLTDSIGDADTRILDTFEESSWGFQNDTAPSQHPHDSMKIPTELAKRASLRSDTYRKHRRRTTTVYHDQIHRSSGLPVNRRITGRGHGRLTYSPSRSNTNFSPSSLRRPLSTSSYTTTRCTSTFSTAPSTITRPSVARQQPRVTTPVENRRSIRVVPASTRSSLVDRPMDEKRNSFIRKRASNQSPFFSAPGSRVSSSTYKAPPAFISDAPSKRNTIVRPDDDVVEGRSKELLDTLKARKPSEEYFEGQRSMSKPSVSPVPETPPKEFPGSLRQNRVARPYTSAGVHRDRVEKSYARPETTIALKSGGMGRRASTRNSLRAHDLKSRLNDLTGSEIFKDAELSDSVYTDEEDEIEEAEKRTTIKPADFTLPPLQIDTRRRSKRNSADKQRIEKQNRASKREIQRELKRTSERDPTPFYSAYYSEHGGKENMSSTHSLSARSTLALADPQPKTKATPSPERPKTARHSRTISDVRKVNRTSKILSQAIETPKERYSRKSLHSRTQYRQSGPSFKKTHSRAQSTAYPFFENPSRPSSIGNAITTAADAVCVQPSATKSSLMMRDLSGNLTFYGDDDEEPTVEELRSSSIGFRTSNGRINSIARRSRLASLHESSQFATPSPPPKSKKRETVVPVPTPSPASVPFPTSTPTAVRPVGLGLFPVNARAELCVGAGSEREHAPLSKLAVENRMATPEVEESGLGVQNGRQTWGGLVGKGKRWVSGGYWDRQAKEDKAFL